MEIDKDLIQDKIDVIEKNLKFLDEYKSVEIEKFLSIYKDVQAVKYSLFEIIESCIDIASHIISVKGFERAESYAEMFEILEKNKIIESKLSRKLSDMARFRNILIHSYAKVDNSKVFTYVKEELIDVRNFIKKLLEITKT
ncbi:hypothetical protein LCGC14_0589390 [marine sediment metagenome]|uniref:DUF86 domain-containing protein n=1 Tax=marine sediment metagenome TaxID=412755 RepID=A0A0F9RIY1_9ZZZZ